MSKITQIKVPEFTLVLEWHLSKRSLQITTMILTVNNTKNTELLKYIWSLKEDQIASRNRWSVIEKVYGRTKTNFCPLCLAEKLHLIKHINDNRSLNKRNEFIGKCRHQVKLLLKSFKWKSFNKMTLIVIYKTEFLCF